jgi:hypothetical protein
MRNANTSIAIIGLAAIVSCGPGNAFESGYIGWQQKAGLTLGGGSAGVPPPGLYTFDQFTTYQAKIVGPGAPNVGGAQTSAHAAGESTGLLWVPGWQFLGATYDAVIVQPFMMSDVGNPINKNPSGMHNTYVVPAELGWKLGNSGFFVKAGLGVYVPTGDIAGPTGLSSIGSPWYTIQPELVVSYLKDGWNLTANLFREINTRNTITGYTSGNIMHAEFTATKRIEKWTFGPVAYYIGQVTDDKSSAFYHGAINVNRYNIWAAGPLVGYDFGPVALTVYGLKEFSATASGGTPRVPGGSDSASITKGFSVFANFSYRLWAPDAPSAPSTKPLFTK